MAPLAPGSGSFQTDVVYVSSEGLEFFDLIESYLSLSERKRVRKAFDLAGRVHGDQLRKSGEPFFTHPLTVAYYLALFRLDAPTLIAALLHDVVEDTKVSIKEVKAQFGNEVSRLVDGVTKLKEVSAEFAQGRALSSEEIRDASLHKMFEAMTGDVRVVLIKLFDRLHNMRTIRAMPPPKQEEKARETQVVYAPLANRLGIWWLKTELEVLSLEVLDNDLYRITSQELDHLFHKRQAIYDRISEQVIEMLVEYGLPVVDVKPSQQSISSVARQLSAGAASFHNFELPLRILVLLQDVPSCYLALGHLHSRWRPVTGKLDDYIAAPRENLYRALHTTVIYSNGEPLKIRFRSIDMHEVSEIGILAKWAYAGSPLWSQGVAERVEALIANINENLDPQNYSSGVKGVVEDVFSRQIMVYTPRGDVVELPQGATPIDFAYAIHTEVGNQCQLAYVNGELYPLNKPLNDGDRVRIVKSGWGRVQRTWLDEDLGFLTTSRAKAQVRRWFRKITDETAIKQGEALLQDELTIIGMGSTSHQLLAEQLGFDKSEGLYYALGRADLLPTEVATHVLEMDWYKEPIRNVGRTVNAENGQAFTITNTSENDLRLCKSCNPRPGDTIIGFIRSNGSVTVHREGCYALRPDPMTRSLLKLSWGREGSYQVRTFTVQVDVYDRSGLIFEISELLSSENINISTINTPPDNGKGRIHVVLSIEVPSPRQLVRILHRAQTLVNVYNVQCLPARENGLVSSTFFYLSEE